MTSPSLCRLLQKIVKFPPTRPLMVDEKQLVWEFRFFFMSDKKALTKFVHSVDWGDIQVGNIHIAKSWFCFRLAGEYLYIKKSEK